MTDTETRSHEQSTHNPDHQASGAAPAFPASLNGHDDFTVSGDLTSLPDTTPADSAPVDPATPAPVDTATEASPEDQATGPAPTRPTVASRHARRKNGQARKVSRYTLDLEPEQHKFLRLFAVSNDVDASKVMRTLLHLLEVQAPLPSGQTLSSLVLDEIFYED